MTKTDSLEILLNQVRLLYNVAVEVGERLHADEPIGLPLRAVLEFLERHGPSTVPAIARSRHVSRQHIQTSVNDLLDAGLVSLRENPAHKRSKLVAFTSEGRRRFGAMRRRERALLGRAGSRLTAKELEHGSRVLEEVRAALERIGLSPERKPRP